MDDATQKLVDEARAVIRDRAPMGGNSDDSLIEGLIAALEAAYSQKVEPEPGPEYKLPGHDDVLSALDRLTIRKRAAREIAAAIRKGGRRDG